MSYSDFIYLFESLDCLAFQSPKSVTYLNHAEDFPIHSFNKNRQWETTSSYFWFGSMIERRLQQLYFNYCISYTARSCWKYCRWVSKQSTTHENSGLFDFMALIKTTRVLTPVGNNIYENIFKMNLYIISIMHWAVSNSKLGVISMLEEPPTNYPLTIQSK